MKPHIHNASETFIYILEGTAIATLDNHHARVRAGDTIYIPAGMSHGFSTPDEAANYLLSDRWVGQWTRNLMGVESLTLRETTAILSRVLNRSIKYVQVTVESIQQRLALTGATPDVQREIGNLFHALGNPNGIYATARTSERIIPILHENAQNHRLD